MDQTKESSSTIKWRYPSSYIIAILSWTTGLISILYNPKLLLEVGFFNYVLVHILVMGVIGIPMTLIELAISQYSLKSVISCWDLCPFFRGVGYGKIILIAIFQVYYNVLNSYTLFYCYNPIPEYVCNQSLSNDTCVNDITASEKFWYTEVAQSDIEGFTNWKLMVSLCGHMVIVFIFNIKGYNFLESLLPLSYIISIFEFAILFCVANTTPGGLEGIKYVIFKSINLNTFLIWKNEGILLQVFQNYVYSMGLALGGISSIAAQEDAFRKPVYATSIWANLANFGNTLVYGIFFANLYGILQFNTKTKIEDFIKYNNSKYEFDYIFTVIPNALNYMPGLDQAWKVIFYSSSYLKGLCTSSLMISTVLNTVYEENPNLSEHSKYWSFLFCTVITILGCLFHTRLGSTAGQFISNTTLKVFLPLILTLEVLTVVIVYGLLRFLDDLYFMVGTYPTIYWALCSIISVIFVPILTSVSVVQYFKNTTMSDFDIILLKAMLSVVLVWIPFMGMVRIIRKVKFPLIFKSSRKWGHANGLKKSRKMFDEHHSIEEFLYEKYLLERKLKKYN